MKFKITRYDDKTRLQLIHYNNLRKYYYKLIEEIMGEDYYTISPDVVNGSFYNAFDYSKKAIMNTPCYQRLLMIDDFGDVEVMYNIKLD